MKYYSFHIRDSGAIKYSEYKLVKGVKTLYGKIYNDPEFNSINDILHTSNFVINDRTRNLWNECKLQEHQIYPAKIKKTKRLIGPIGIPMEYDFHEIVLQKEINNKEYSWIDYTKSQVEITKNETPTGKLIGSHEELIDILQKSRNSSQQINKIYFDETLDPHKKDKMIKSINTYSWESKIISFGKNFNSSIDLFEIRLHSFGTYVSEKFKEKMEKNNVSDVGFSSSKDKLGVPWRSHYPIIHFKKNTYR